MRIPKKFKQAVASTFYDKQFTIYSIDEVVDEEGGTTRTASSAGSTFNGNVVDNVELVQEQYGISEKFDIAVTTSTDVDIEQGSIFSYSGRLYEVTRIMAPDSHLLVTARKWQ